MSYKTEQEAFWAGDFGNAYVERSSNPVRIAHRTAIFSKILARTRGVGSVIELGANIGQNLIGIQRLMPNARLTGVEINDTAAAQLAATPGISKVHHGSMLDFSPEQLGKHDLTFTSGVLIHINPDEVQEVYRRLYECSNKYVVVNEYYNPQPVEVNYRGHAGRLFKRDFAGEIMDRYPDLELVDYGFQYHRDPNFPADDCTWFLMKKPG